MPVFEFFGGNLLRLANRGSGSQARKIASSLLCLVCSLLFHSGVVEWSFLGFTGVVYSHKATSRLALCLVRIEMKLRRFPSPHPWA